MPMKWGSPVVRLVFVLLAAGAVGVGTLSYREYERGKRIQDEIAALKLEAEKIEVENDSLSQKIMYFDSPDFQEREAKDKLGYRRLEEKEVLISGTPPTETRVIAKASEPDLSIDIPNYQKWWRLFFH